MLGSRLRRMRTLGSLVALATVTTIVSPTAPAAATTVTTPWFVTMTSERGDYIGGGQSRLFDSTNAVLTADASSQGVALSVSGGLTGDSFSFNFRAPTGVTFKPGSYPRAEGYPFEAAGRPGIDVGGDGRGCNEQSGHFDVRDFAVNSSGTITRLWLLYEQHCEGGLPSLFGEVRIGIPAGAAVAAPDTIRWPDTYPNSAGQAVPVWVRPRASTPVTLTGVALAGPNARDFLIRGDECTGLTVHQGDYCVVYVRCAPKGSGPRTGS